MLVGTRSSWHSLKTSVILLEISQVGIRKGCPFHSMQMLLPKSDFPSSSISMSYNRSQLTPPDGGYQVCLLFLFKHHKLKNVTGRPINSKQISLASTSVLLSDTCLSQQCNQMCVCPVPVCLCCQKTTVFLHRIVCRNILPKTSHKHTVYLSGTPYQ